MNTAKSSRRNVIQRTFDAFGEQHGLQKKSGSWYGRTDDCTIVLNLQKSDYGPSYYVNLGYWLRPSDSAPSALVGQEASQDGLPYPKAWSCHVHWRLEALASSRREVARILSLLDLDAPMTDEAREAALGEVLEELLGRYLDPGLTIEQLRRELCGADLSQVAITGFGRQVLGDGIGPAK